MTWVVDTDENGKQKLKSEDDLRRERQEEQELKRNKDADEFSSLARKAVTKNYGFSF